MNIYLYTSGWPRTEATEEFFSQSDLLLGGGGREVEGLPFFEGSEIDLT